MWLRRKHSEKFARKKNFKGSHQLNSAFKSRFRMSEIYLLVALIFICAVAFRLVISCCIAQYCKTQRLKKTGFQPSSSFLWENECNNSAGVQSDISIFIIENRLESSGNVCNKLPTFEECLAKETPPPSYEDALKLAALTNVKM